MSGAAKQEDNDIGKMTSENIAESDECARESVRQMGGTIIKEFDEINCSPVRVFHIKFNGVGNDLSGDGYYIFILGGLVGQAVDWDAAKVIGASLAHTACEAFEIGQPEGTTEMKRLDQLETAPKPWHVAHECDYKIASEATGV